MKALNRRLKEAAVLLATIFAVVANGGIIGTPETLVKDASPVPEAIPPQKSP